MKGIIGRKRGMTQVWSTAGQVVPVTVIEAGPCPVVQVKTVAKDGYDALQLGFGTARTWEPQPGKRTPHGRRPSKAMKGHFAKAGVLATQTLSEIRFTGAADWKAGSEVKADIFKVGEIVDVRGMSRGRGFQGGVRRYGFAGGPRAHGSKAHREPGSIGQCATPGRVWKGHRMAGHMGARMVTARQVEVVQVDAARNLLLLKGSVPGASNGFLLIRKRGA